MCLSMVYKNKRDEESLLAKDVATMKQEGEELIFADLLGRETRIKGTIEKVDLLDNYIIIDERK